MKVGEKFEYEGVMLEVAGEPQWDDCCEGCYFQDKNVCPKDEHNDLLCINHFDLIIFKEVKKWKEKSAKDLSIKE